jgi:hypothetical protein
VHTPGTDLPRLFLMSSRQHNVTRRREKAKIDMNQTKPNRVFAILIKATHYTRLSFHPIQYHLPSIRFI